MRVPEAERGLNRTLRECPEFPVVARCSRPRRRAAGYHSIGNVALHIVVTSRRSLLRAGLTAAAVTAAAPLLPGAAAAAPGPAPARPPGDPFGLGVASGEPDATSVVLWTRLATDPLADDGLGGVGNRATDVEWEIADDERFTRVVRRGRVRTGPEAGHSVHVEVPGLRPGRDYHYRFRVGRTVSDAGRTRTAPPPASMTPVHMAFTSCSQFEHGWFTAYRRMADERPDVLLHLGDYIYEYPAKYYVAPGGNVRDHAGPETTTLAGYRQRLAQYHADADLQAAHAAAPWLVVFDDPASPVVGTELVSSSITSGGDGSEKQNGSDTVLAENPHIRFHNNRRGYVSTRFTADRMEAEFKVVPFVKQPGAPVQTRGRFVTEDRRPGLRPV